MNFELILADVNDEVCVAFQRLFRHQKVSIEPGDLFDVSADAYVSPANCHGIMDGGFDLLLRRRFPRIESRIQREFDLLGGMLPIGQAVVVETDDDEVPYLVCAPTMVTPSVIGGTRNVHAAMLACLKAVHRFNVENDNEIMSLAVTGLGTGVGRMMPEVAVRQMRDAFDEFLGEL